ncbi:hypothetical protein HOY82DRAFT_537121 [Tuber indicum]|nr:hypothetical protein HOY82DRAFT_537121 [Tuber indicum]
MMENGRDHWSPGNYHPRHWDRGPCPQANTHDKNAHTGDGNMVPRGPRKHFRSQSPPPYREGNPNFLDRPPQRRNHTRGSHQRPQRYSRTPHTNRPRCQMNPREFNPRHSHSQANPRGAFRLAPYGQNRDARERFGGNCQMGAATRGLGGGCRGSEDRGVASLALGMPASSELVPQSIQELHQEDSETPQETGWDETPEHSPE